MTACYFPGCTLKSSARALDIFAVRSAAALGVSLEELDNWQCCGGVYRSSSSEYAARLPAVRAICEAKRQRRPLVTVCSACHNVLKRTEHALLNDKKFAEAVKNYDRELIYEGGAEIIHYFELLRDKIGFEKIREKIKKPQVGIKAAGYYGCLLLRPGSVMRFDDPENPSVIEDFLSALGCEVVRFPLRNECCGGCLSINGGTERLSSEVCRSARSHGAEVLITACPLCEYNLIKSQSEILVRYFTEILADALGIGEAENE